MPGDAKAESRKRKRNDQVERFTESRLALQRAMERDYRTSLESQRAVEDDRAPVQKVEEREANAERLAALLEAARRQSEAAVAETGNVADAKKASSINRARARPASYLTADVRAARARATHPEPATTPAAAAAIAPPPLVDRDADIPSDSAGKLVVRLMIVAVIVGVAGYVFAFPKSTEEPVSAAEEPAAAPAPGPAVPADRVAAASAEAANPVPPVGNGPGTGAGTGASDETTPSAAALTDAPASPAPAEVTPAAPVSDTSESGTPEVRAPATVSVPAVLQAADIPLPPPPPLPIAQPSADATPEQASPKSSIGEETLRALRLIETDATSVGGVSAEAAPSDSASGAAQNPPADTPGEIKVSADGSATTNGLATTDGSANGEAAPAGPVSKQQRLADRRPPFRRLGPTPAPNPFRPGKSEPEPEPVPAPTPTPSPPINFSLFDIE